MTIEQSSSVLRLKLAALYENKMEKLMEHIKRAVSLKTVLFKTLETTEIHSFCLQVVLGFAVIIILYFKSLDTL